MKGHNAINDVRPPATVLRGLAVGHDVWPRQTRCQHPPEHVVQQICFPRPFDHVWLAVGPNVMKPGVDRHPRPGPQKSGRVGGFGGDFAGVGADADAFVGPVVGVGVLYVPGVGVAPLCVKVRADDVELT